MAAPNTAGSVAILKDDFPASTANSSPDLLAAVLQRNGFSSEFLTSGELADRKRLNREQIDVLVLPYGPSFPVAAASNFREFLRAGGKFFSTGGYAFDHLLERGDHGWINYRLPVPTPRDSTAWFYDIPAADLRGQGPITFHGFLKSAGVAGPGFAHFSIYQVAADGSLPAWRDLCQVRGTQDWQEYRFAFDVHPNAAKVSLRAGLYRCRGEAWFDDVRLTDAAGKVLFSDGFEERLQPDEQRTRNWWRSHKELCEWQSQVAHAGKGALKAALSFEIPRVERLNTRQGRPEDGLEVEPTQLGVFQADYPLCRAQSAAAAPMQSVIDRQLHLDEALAGWAACGVVGWDQARWIPLIEAHDRYGRLRGAVGGVLRHYAGPWAGSSWAIFGVTNRDLFAADQTSMQRALVDVTRSLVRDTYFISLNPDRGCYREGENVRFLAPLFNGSRVRRDLRVVLEVFDGEPVETASPPSRAGQGGRPALQAVKRFTASLTVAPGATNAPNLEWKPDRLGSDFYHVVASLWEGEEEIDRAESGLVVWQKRILDAGPKLSFRDNYLRFGQRPLFLFGTDDWSYVFNTTRETPLQWLRDMRQRRDFGVQIYENLQFGIPEPLAAAAAKTDGPNGYEHLFGMSSLLTPQEKLLRKVDGVVQLAQKYDQVYFAGLLIGYNAAASDAELAQERDYCRDFAKRYAGVPGLIYYLNGDYRCELNAGVTPQWNVFLRDRYQSEGSLRAAWGRFAPTPPLGQIPIENYQDWEQTWEDVSAYDRNCFRAWLMRRWNSSLIAGIREVDRTHPTSGEFYQLPHSGVDLPAGIDGLDLANFGFFEKRGADLAKFPGLCLYNDQRARGKSSGPGEYGVKVHPAWGDGKDYGYHTARTGEEAIDLFLGVAHCALGLGASRIHNWCWKDDAHRVFPWGLIYPADGVPRDTAYAHRNQSFLFRHFAPAYESPEVFVLTPDCHRLGGGKWRVIDGTLACLDLVLASHVPNPGTLNEQGLEIGNSAKVIFQPVPFCLTDETYAKLLHWVQRGGVLYLFGDLSYDELRRRTHSQRLEELCGVRFLSENYPNILVNPTNAADQPCIKVERAGGRVLRSGSDGQPLLIEHHVGAGRVFFNTDPIELHAVPVRRDSNLDIYRQVLAAGGIESIGLQPNDPLLQTFRVPLRGGGRVWIVFNQDMTHPSREATLADLQPPVTVNVAAHRPALLWCDSRGALRAIESQGECRVAGEVILRDETGGIALSLDQQDLRRSRAFVLMPLRSGNINVSQQQGLKRLAVEAGEIQNGQWRTFGSLATATAADRLSIRVGSDQVFTWLLVCDPTETPRWRNAIERAMTDPGALP